MRAARHLHVSALRWPALSITAGQRGGGLRCGGTVTAPPRGQEVEGVATLLGAFNPAPEAPAAFTPPGSWYTSQRFYEAEVDSVFRVNWLHVGRLDQLSTPGSFFTGEVVGQPYIVARTDAGDIRAMYNVCAHHAAIVVREAQGCAREFTCPYHGWCYQNNGRLVKAHKISGIENFRARDNGLKPIQVDTMGPFVFINFSDRPLPPVREVLGAAVQEPLEAVPRSDKLRFVSRVQYKLASNWKVFCDNYLDGGYHVSIAHPKLAAGLDLGSYSIQLVPNGTLQTVPAIGGDRLGLHACYAFAYPNFMVNRYGPWMDTNTVVPKGADASQVIFDYYLDEEMVRQQDPDVDIEQFIADSMVASNQVQLEDEELCESVQRGLASRGYTAGRYVPSLEHGMHAFHRQIHQDVSRACT